MAYSDDMIHIAQRKLQQLIRQDTRRIREAKKRMIRKNSPQPHSPRMQNSLMTKTTQTRMPMHNLNPLPQNDIPEYREKGKHSRERGFSIDDKKGHVVDFETVGQIPDAGSALIGMSDDDDLVAAIDEFGGELVDVAFNAAGLGEEEVADHGDVVGHCGGL